MMSALLMWFSTFQLVFESILHTCLPGGFFEVFMLLLPRFVRYIDFAITIYSTCTHHINCQTYIYYTELRGNLYCADSYLLRHV